MAEQQIRQRTLAREILHSGIGLHTGKIAQLRVRPAPPDTGILIRRLSGGPAEDVAALWSNWVPEFLCSGIRGTSGVPILTVEHLMASLRVFGVDNALVELDGTEIPIDDGSALGWCGRIAEAGLVEQDPLRRYLQPLEPLEYGRDGAFIRIEPDDHFSLHVTSVPRGFGPLVWEGVPTPETFRRDIAPSRSHGPVAAAGVQLYFFLRGQTRLRGASYKTVALTVGRHFLGGMRVPDEPVRHRVLDLIGDLSLAGLPFLGRVTAYQPSHALNGEFVHALMNRPSAWTVAVLG